MRRRGLGLNTYRPYRRSERMECAHRTQENHYRHGGLARQRHHRTLAAWRCHEWAAFRTYVADVLAPTLQPGDTVVLENLPAQEVRGIRERIEAVGARLLYLPAYSPDFNPIELAFAKLKTLLRSAAARPIPDLWEVTGRGLTRFAPTECRAYLADTGYDTT